MDAHQIRSRDGTPPVGPDQVVALSGTGYTLADGLTGEPQRLPERATGQD
jgi:hypothetical protein